MKKIIIFIVIIYQRFISIFSYGSCRFYPTCSNYCIWKFEQDGFFKALYSTIYRLLRCNRFFLGGIDYPIIVLKYDNYNNIIFNKIAINYWYIRIEKNKFYMIKNLTKNLNINIDKE